MGVLDREVVLAAWAALMVAIAAFLLGRFPSKESELAIWVRVILVLGLFS